MTLVYKIDRSVSTRFRWSWICVNSGGTVIGASGRTRTLWAAVRACRAHARLHDADVQIGMPA